MEGLGFNSWVGHLGTWDFSRGRSQRHCTLAKSKEHLGTPLSISPRWLECVDDKMSARTIKSHSLTKPYGSMVSPSGMGMGVVCWTSGSGGSWDLPQTCWRIYQDGAASVSACTAGQALSHLCNILPLSCEMHPSATTHYTNNLSCLL